jgi:ATP-dependent DNA ligase
VTNFELLRAKREVFLYAFDLVELDGRDMRREPWSDPRGKLARLLRGVGHGVQLPDHLEGSDGEAAFRQ